MKEPTGRRLITDQKVILFATFLVLNGVLGLTPSNFFGLGNCCNPLKHASPGAPFLSVHELSRGGGVFASALLDAGPALGDAHD
jgi:hypothetical protein